MFSYDYVLKGHELEQAMAYKIIQEGMETNEKLEKNMVGRPADARNSDGRWLRRKQSDDE
jgi:hypothetical protein